MIANKAEFKNSFYLTPHAAGVFLLILIVYFWLITYGSGKLFEIRDDSGTGGMDLVNGVPYDSLGESLLEGRAEVDPGSILWEGFLIHGETYMYFGPFPALLRILPNLLFPDMYGRWSRIFCLSASVLCLFAFIFIIKNCLGKNQYLTLAEKKLYFTISLLGFGLGTPLLILLTESHVYHESILWGLSSCLWGVYFTKLLLSSEGNSVINLILISFCAGVAFLSKVTFGVVLYLILLYIVSYFIFSSIFRKSSFIKRFEISGLSFFLSPSVLKSAFKLILCLLPGIAALTFQLWYNNARFNSIFTFIDFNYYLREKGSFETIKLLANTFNFERLPTSLFNYFGFRKEYFVPLPPFVIIPVIKIFKPGILFFNNDCRAISLCLVSMWLVIGSVIGTRYLCLRGTLIPEKILGLILSVNCIMILSFHGVTQRYTTEFLPFMIFLYSYFLLNTGSTKVKMLSKKTIAFILVLSCLLSVITTIISDLHWTYVRVPIRDYRFQIVEIFKYVYYVKHFFFPIANNR